MGGLVHGARPRARPLLRPLHPVLVRTASPGVGRGVQGQAQARTRLSMTRDGSAWEDSSSVPTRRYVYDFDEPCEGGRRLLGGKGIGLAEMTHMGVPVPAGFTITTEASRAAMALGGELPEGLA